MGSFFTFYGSKLWKRKNSKESNRTSTKTAPKKLAESLQGPWRMGEVKVQVYTASPALLEVATQEEPSLPPPLHDHDFVHLHCEVEFDPEKDYAQVLAEARSHLKGTSIFKNETISTTHARPLQHHLDAYKELHMKLAKPKKPSKLWRLLFWQKPSYTSQEQMEAEFESIFSSPPHPSSKTSHKGMGNQRKEAQRNGYASRPTRKGTSGPISYNTRPSRKNCSGPLYTDGLPVVPYNMKHTKKSYSGPLGPTNYSNNLDPHFSPYQPLYTPRLSSPLYSC